MWYPNGISHLRASPLWRPSAEFSLHLTAPYLHRKAAWIKNNSITGFHLCFHFPRMQKENERKGGRKWKKEIMWKKLQHRAGMFDIHLDSEGGVQSQVCVYVCDGMGVTLSSEGKHRRNVWSSIVIILLCFLLFHVEEPKTTIFRKFPFFSYHIVLSFDSIDLCGDTLICILLKHSWIHWREQVGNWSPLFVACLESIPCQCLIQLLGGNGQVFKQMPASLIGALPHPSICQSLAK